MSVTECDQVQQQTAALSKCRLKEIRTRKVETKKQTKKEEEGRRRQETTEQVCMHCIIRITSL